jgi:hypothetical protein
MFHRVLLLLSVPSAVLLGQSRPLVVSITSDIGAIYEMVPMTNASTGKPVRVRGNTQVRIDSGALELLTVYRSDSLNRFHVEVTDGARSLVRGDGAFVTIRRDDRGVSIETRSRPLGASSAASSRSRAEVRSAQGYRLVPTGIEGNAMKYDLVPIPEEW